MARVRTPEWHVLVEVGKELGLSDDWYAVDTKRSYVREDGVFRAKGWLLSFKKNWQDDEVIYHFLPD